MDKNWKIRTGEEYKKRVRKLEWLWEPLILKNCVSLLVADGGIGKSGFSLWLADQLCGKGHSATYLEIEGFGGGIVERLETWDLPNHEKILFPVYEINEELDVSLSVNSYHQIESIIKHCHSDLLIIDSLTALSCGKDLNQASVASDLFNNLATITDRYKTAILVLAHTNKDSSGDPLSILSMRGSGSMPQLARTVMTLENAVGSYDITKKRLTQHKTNIVGSSSTVTFTLDEQGLRDYKLDGDELRREEGTRAAKFRAVAIKCFSEGKNQVETKAEIRELKILPKATSEEWKRAMDYATKKLKIIWEG